MSSKAVQYRFTAFPSSSKTELVKSSTLRIAQGEKPLYFGSGCKMASGFLSKNSRASRFTNSTSLPSTVMNSSCVIVAFGSNFPPPTPETRPMAAIAFTEGAYQLPLATSVKYPSAVE